MALFVEGSTEQRFAVRLIREVAGEHRVVIQEAKASGPQSGRSIVLLSGSSEENGTSASRSGTSGSIDETDKPFFVQVVDCGSDSSVKSDIRDNYKSLTDAGFEAIVGIRDVYPLPRGKIDELRLGLQYKIKTVPVAPVFVLGVMEIESWFLGESTHFPRIHERLAQEEVTRILGFDPGALDPQERDHPSADLNLAYQHVGYAYRKKRNQVQRTVDALDYALLYLQPREIPDLIRLIEVLDEFFSATPGG